MFMQDIGSKEDTELSRQELTLSWRELCVESPGHCQPVGNWIFLPRATQRTHRIRRGKPIDSCWERVVTKERCVKRNQYEVGFKNLDLTELGVILVTVMAQRQRTGL